MNISFSYIEGLFINKKHNIFECYLNTVSHVIGRIVAKFRRGIARAEGLDFIYEIYFTLRRVNTLQLLAWF